MRDPNRIRRILPKVEALWSLQPDLRLGQLLVNLTPGHMGNDPFNLEDEELENILDKRLGVWST